MHSNRIPLSLLKTTPYSLMQSAMQGVQLAYTMLQSHHANDLKTAWEAEEADELFQVHVHNVYRWEAMQRMALKIYQSRLFTAEMMDYECSESFFLKPFELSTFTSVQQLHAELWALQEAYLKELKRYAPSKPNKR